MWSLAWQHATSSAAHCCAAPHGSRGGLMAASPYLLSTLARAMSNKPNDYSVGKHNMKAVSASQQLREDMRYRRDPQRWS